MARVDPSLRARPRFAHRPGSLLDERPSAASARCRFLDLGHRLGARTRPTASQWHG